MGTWIVDGKPAGRAGWPYSARWRLAVGRHTVEARASGRRSAVVPIEVR